MEASLDDDKLSLFFFGRNVLKRFAFSFIVFAGLASALRADSSDDWNQQVKTAALDQHKGDLKGAEKILLRALLTTESFNTDDPRAAFTLDYLGTLYQQQGRNVDAVAVFRRALKDFDGSLGPHSNDALSSAGRLADAYEAAGLWAKAEPLRRRLLRELAGEEAPDPALLAQAESDLALCLDAQKKWDEAMVLYADALQKRRNALGPGSPEVAETLSNEGRVWLLRGRPVEAEQLMRQALAIDVKALGPGNPAVADDLRRLAVVLKRRGETAEAALDEARAAAMDEARKRSVPAAAPPRPTDPGEDPGPGESGARP